MTHLFALAALFLPAVVAPAVAFQPGSFAKTHPAALLFAKAGRGFFYAACLYVFAAALLLPVGAAGAAPGGRAGMEQIRDIEGPLPPSDLPPFAATAAVIVAAAAGTSLARRSKRKPEVAEAVPVADPIEAEIAALRQAYLKGEVSVAHLFDRLYEVLRSALPVPPGSDRSALTSSELLEAVPGIVPPSLFRLCDEIRFGGETAAREAVISALNDAAAVAASLRR